MEMVKKGWYKTWWGITLLIFTAFMLSLGFAFFLFVYNIAKNINNQPTSYSFPELSLEEKQLIEGNNNYWIGSANPKIIIVEFADFACSYCKNSFPKIREIGIKYKKEVKHIFRDFPAQGENSVNLAIAARCAGEQGLFWLMHDKLFQNQGVTETNEIIALANQVGADTAKFNSCFSAQKFINNIKKDFSDAQALGVTGTPTWFINGQKVEGDIPYDIFIQIIEELIQKN